MSFGIQNPEVTPEKNVTAIPCEMQNFFYLVEIIWFPTKIGELLKIDGYRVV